MFPLDKLKTILIDDHHSVRENLKLFLQHQSDVEVVGEADGVQSGLEAIALHKPDLVLLDVEMGDGTGFDLLNLSGTPDFKVIFVTGHDKFAIKAFKFSVVDYLLKPVDITELENAIRKVRHREIDQNISISNLLSFRRASQCDPHIILKDADAVYRVAVKDISRCQSETNYTTFFLNDGRQLIISKTLKEYDKLLSEYGFLRVHQSHLINLHQFDHYARRDGGELHMKDGSVLPVAVRKKDMLMTALAQIG